MDTNVPINVPINPPYSNREMDEKFREIKDILNGQNDDLSEIKNQTKTTNGNVAKAFLQIAETKGNVASNWRAIWVGSVMFVGIIIPLCGVIYYNLSKQVNQIQSQIIKLQTK